MTTNEKKILLERLEQLKLNGPRYRCFGICYNIGLMKENDPLRDVNPRMFGEYLADWPDHSGDNTYPVPSPSEFVAPNSYFWHLAYRHDRSMWEGQQGVYRASLINFAINKLRFDL